MKIIHKARAHHAGEVAGPRVFQASVNGYCDSGLVHPHGVRSKGHRDVQTSSRLQTDARRVFEEETEHGFFRLGVTAKACKQQA